MNEREARQFIGVMGSLRFLEEEGKEKSNEEKDRHIATSFFGVIGYPAINSDTISLWNNYNDGGYNA